MFLSISKGFLLGSIVWMLSILADYTISENNTKILIKENYQLYYSANKSLFINMLIISPIIYGFIDKYFIDHIVPPITFQLFNIMYV